ncbi:MAG: ABC transporter permease [Acidobacteriota bacterium]
MLASLRDIWVLYLRESRAALRERTIVFNSIVMPIVLYPFMLWAMFTGIVFVRGQTEGFVSRLAVVGLKAEHRELRSLLERDDRLTLVKEAPASALAAEQIRKGDLDALVEILPPTGTGTDLASNFQARLTVNKSKERSDEARQRVVALLERYRDDWLKREGTRLGVTPAEWQVLTIDERNTASSRDMGAFLLGLLLPLFFVIMVAVGCFYPAVDATAGERERNTWETLMTVAASRVSIITAKYLYVATFGCIAGLLNLIAMTLSMRAVLAPLLARSGESLEFKVPLVAFPVMAVGAVLLGLFVAAGMMIFASFARTFKEGQSMVTPFYLLIMLPVMFLQVPGIEFTIPLALIPIVNVAMMVREAIAGTFHWLQIGLTLGVEIATIAACLWLATAILRFEDVVIGSYGGSLGKLVKERLLKRDTRARAAGGEA